MFIIHISLCRYSWNCSVLQVVILQNNCQFKTQPRFVLYVPRHYSVVRVALLVKFCTLGFKIDNSIEYGPSWKADSHTPGQKYSSFFCNLQVCYFFQKFPLRGSVVNLMNPVYTHFLLRLSVWFSAWNFVYVSFHSHVCHMSCPPYCPLFYLWY